MSNCVLSCCREKELDDVGELLLWISHTNPSQHPFQKLQFYHMVTQLYPCMKPFFMDAFNLSYNQELEGLPHMSEIIKVGWEAMVWLHTWQHHYKMNKDTHLQSYYTITKNRCQYMMKIRWGQLMNEIRHFSLIPPSGPNKVGGYYYNLQKVEFEDRCKCLKQI